MTKPRLPRDLLDPIVAYFKPRRGILFGSRARGGATRDSDIDLLVVVDDDAPAGSWPGGRDMRRIGRAAPPMCFRCAPKLSSATALSSERSRPRPTASSSTARQKGRR